MHLGNASARNELVQEGQQEFKFSSLKKTAYTLLNYHFLLFGFLVLSISSCPKKMLVMLLWSLKWDLREKTHQWDGPQDEFGVLGLGPPCRASN